MKREEKKKDYANTFRTMTSIAVRLNAFHINISDALCAYFIPSVLAIPFSYDVYINLSGDSPGMVLSNGIRHTNIQYDWHSLNDHGITPDSLYWSPDCNSIGLPNIWNEAKTNRKNETSERRNTKMNRTMDYCSVLSYQTRTHTRKPKLLCAEFIRMLMRACAFSPIFDSFVSRRLFFTQSDQSKHSSFCIRMQIKRPD